MSLVTSSPTVFFWILSAGKRYITKVALEDCNLVEEFKAVTCENCRKVREDIRMCLCFSSFVVIFCGFFMIKDKMTKWSKIKISKARVSNCPDITSYLEKSWLNKENISCLCCQGTLESVPLLISPKKLREMQVNIDRRLFNLILLTQK